MWRVARCGRECPSCTQSLEEVGRNRVGLVGKGVEGQLIPTPVSAATTQCSTTVLYFHEPGRTLTETSRNFSQVTCEIHASSKP